MEQLRLTFSIEVSKLLSLLLLYKQKTYLLEPSDMKPCDDARPELNGPLTLQRKGI